MLKKTNFHLLPDRQKRRLVEADIKARMPHKKISINNVTDVLLPSMSSSPKENLLKASTCSAANKEVTLLPLSVSDGICFMC